MESFEKLYEQALQQAGRKTGKLRDAEDDLNGLVDRFFSAATKAGASVSTKSETYYSSTTGAPGKLVTLAHPDNAEFLEAYFEAAPHAWRAYVKVRERQGGKSKQEYGWFETKGPDAIATKVLSIVQDKLLDGVDPYLDREEEQSYADYPPWITKAKHKTNFLKIWREWIHYIRGGADLNEIADRLTAANPGNPTGDLPFSDQIDIMYNAAHKNMIRKAIKERKFVRFYIRSPKGKKLWAADPNQRL